MFVTGKFSNFYYINTEQEKSRFATDFLLCYTTVMTFILTKEVTLLDAQKRRNAIARALAQANTPVSATALAKEFSVSRQIIVGDIALLRAAGSDITATPRGYIVPRSTVGVKRTLACRHTAAEMESELYAMVDQGCTVLDVIVDHPIYGQLTGPLNLSNRYEVGQFIDRCREEAAAPLSLLTEGIHLHSVLCPDEGAFARVQTALRELGVLLED